MITYTVSSTSVRALLAGLGALALDTDTLRKTAGIDASLVADPDHRFAEAELIALWTAAESTRTRPPERLS